MEQICNRLPVDNVGSGDSGGLGNKLMLFYISY